MMTGQPLKVCYRAMERAHKRGYVEYGVSLRTAWLLPKGLELLQEQMRSGWWFTNKGTELYNQAVK
jgi:hypothetical protein